MRLINDWSRMLLPRLGRSFRFWSLPVCLFVFLGWLSLQAQPDDIDSMIANMTLEQKVGQLFMVNLHGLTLDEEAQEYLQTWHPGAVVLFGSNAGTPEEVVQLTNCLQQAVIEGGDLPLFVATDQEGGVIARLKDEFTQWPIPMVLTAANDPELAYRVGGGMARELIAVGVNMNLAPVADLRTNLDNIVIGRRSPGNDPVMVGMTLSGLVRGMQDGGVMATVKHFPGHGDTDQDSHLELPTLSYGRERLYTLELPPFMSAINADVGVVMIAHIWFSAFEPDTPLPASLSYNVVTGLLREELGYDGLIMADALDMDAIDSHYTLGEAAVLAIQAGVDFLPVGPLTDEEGQTQMIQYVVNAVREEQITLARIEESVRRILEAKQRFGVLTWSPLEVDGVAERMDRVSNEALVEEMFRAGVTLVYDRYGLTPFDTTEPVGIVFPLDVVDVFYSCSQYSTNIVWLPVSVAPLDYEIDAAVNLAVQVRALVVFTREALSSPPQQVLVNSLPEQKTIVVALGSPYDWRRFPQVGAYVVTYDLFAPAVTASCGILFGIFPPLGRLPVALGDELPAGTNSQN